MCASYTVARQIKKDAVSDCVVKINWFIRIWTITVTDWWKRIDFYLFYLYLLSYPSLLSAAYAVTIWLACFPKHECVSIVVFIVCIGWSPIVERRQPLLNLHKSTRVAVTFSYEFINFLFFPQPSTNTRSLLKEWSGTSTLSTNGASSSASSWLRR